MNINITKLFVLTITPDKLPNNNTNINPIKLYLCVKFKNVFLKL